ncbi:MAG: type II toxin-antitoxin system RelB/DinJ family antitoxin [Oenococcus sp.]|uniref:type II toxin-antitoxin system RelB/DinJ family antitoxin n=1 Tax=Oenococcus TaxID=46254 RepID=UPI000863111A|nr:type II toxin-antitoxin system RelB/DinJ family antitoxin [Oenococcus kitaharae]
MPATAKQKKIVQARVENDIKEHANAIFKTLGIDASTAINIYYHQVVIHNGLPFLVQKQAIDPEVEKAMVKAQAEELGLIPDDSLKLSKEQRRQRWA